MASTLKTARACGSSRGQDMYGRHRQRANSPNGRPLMQSASSRYCMRQLGVDLLTGCREEPFFMVLRGSQNLYRSECRVCM